MRYHGLPPCLTQNPTAWGNFGRIRPVQKPARCPAVQRGISHLHFEHDTGLVRGNTQHLIYVDIQKCDYFLRIRKVARSLSHKSNSSRQINAFVFDISTSSLRSNGLGDLVGVVAVLLLELLNESNVPLLGLLGGDTLVDKLLPGVLLGLALYCGSYVLAEA